jgi:hypothetical protein
VVAVTDPVEVVTVTVITDVPAETPVTSPVLFTVATLVLPELQPTWLDRSFVELSSNVPVAVNCVVDPVATVGEFGVIASEVSPCALTITLPVEFTPSCDAVIVAFPSETAATIPAASTVAEPDDDVHFAEFVTSLLFPSTVVPFALNCLDSPTFRKIEVGVTVMLFNALPPTKKPSQLLHASDKAITSIRRPRLTKGRRADCMLHLMTRILPNSATMKGQRLVKKVQLPIGELLWNQAFSSVAAASPVLLPQSSFCPVA